MHFLLGLLLSFLGPTEVVVPPVYSTVFYHAAIRARDTGAEVVYCAIGYKRGNQYRVTALVKPRQTAYQFQTYSLRHNPERNVLELWVQRVSGVSHEPCPARTIMDIHPHPPFNRDVEKDLTPSETDLSFWSQTPYKLHTIVTADSRGNVHTATWLGTKRLYVRNPQRPLR